jgi:hypothetical protein
MRPDRPVPSAADLPVISGRPRILSRSVCRHARTGSPPGTSPPELISARRQNDLSPDPASPPESEGVAARASFMEDGAAISGTPMVMNTEGEFHQTLSFRVVSAACGDQTPKSPSKMAPVVGRVAVDDRVRRRALSTCRESMSGECCTITSTPRTRRRTARAWRSLALNQYRMDCISQIISPSAKFDRQAEGSCSDGAGADAHDDRQSLRPAHS